VVKILLDTHTATSTLGKSLLTRRGGGGEVHAAGDMVKVSRSPAEVVAPLFEQVSAQSAAKEGNHDSTD
jgi:hypothetical protein